MDNEYKYNELVEKRYEYDISLSFDTGAMFNSAQKALDTINGFMAEMMPAESGKLVARSDGLEMNLSTVRKLTATEKATITEILLKQFESTFPNGKWRVDSFELNRYTEKRI